MSEDNVNRISEAKPRNRKAAKKTRTRVRHPLDDILEPARRKELQDRLVDLTKSFHAAVSIVAAEYGVKLVETVQFQIET